MEKYGEIPPRFTREWWGYFWEYYKWHIVITAAALLLAMVWLYQCTHRPQYDSTIIYAGHKTYSESEQDRLSELAAEYIGDVDGNGEVSIYFQPLVFAESVGNTEYDYAVQTKLDLTFTDDCTFIYLLDDIEAALYMRRDTIADMFENTDLYAAGTDKETMTGETDGVPYAVSLADSTLLKENNIYCDDLYLLVRVGGKDDEINNEAHKRALSFAEALVR